MQNINPENIFNYMDNIVSTDKITKLMFVSIARSICHVTLQIKSHGSDYCCHCLKCCIYGILFTVLSQRKKEKLLLFVRTDNYQTISNAILYNYFSI